MLIRVLRFRGRAPDLVTEALFTEAGGTIGRSPECTLALPDPERHVSRIQAEISYAGGKFILVDRGIANPIQCNGEVVSAGQAVVLRDGDELHVGDYVLRVEFGRTEFPQTKAGVPRDSSAAPADPTSGFAPTALNIDHSFAAAAKPAPAAREDCAALDSGKGAPKSAPPPGGNASPAQPAMPAARLAEQETHRPGRLPPSSADVADTAFRSWDNPEGISPTMIVGRREPRAPLAKEDAQPVEAAEKIAGLVNRAANAHQHRFVPLPKNHTTGFLQELNRKVMDAKPPASRDEETHGGLVQALLSGAGLQDCGYGRHLDGELDEETMRRIGALLRIFAQGFIDLLATRAAVKSEMRAEMTIISADENNPLKFSPDATTALNHLLAARTVRGFMKPEAAVQDAVNDLLAHQAGVMAGVRAALEGLLQRFSPQVLEKRLSARSVFDAMLPMNRKAKLWELFEETFNEVSQQAQEDFNTLFGREFVKAYETQIRRLEAGDG